MKQKILDYINSNNFQNALRTPLLTMDPIEFNVRYLASKSGSSIKSKGGIYFLYDDNVHGHYSSTPLWYIGISGNEPVRTRVQKHRKRALGIFNDTPLRNWVIFNEWLQLRGHSEENGIFDNNCKVLWLEIVNSDLTKSQLELLEMKCVMALEPILNMERFSVFGTLELDIL